MVCEEQEPALSDVGHADGIEHLCACHFRKPGTDPGPDVARAGS
jgi:hypothetical protein